MRAVALELSLPGKVGVTLRDDFTWTVEVDPSGLLTDTPNGTFGFQPPDETAILRLDGRTLFGLGGFRFDAVERNDNGFGVTDTDGEMGWVVTLVVDE